MGDVVTFERVEPLLTGLDCCAEMYAAAGKEKDRGVWHRLQARSLGRPVCTCLQHKSGLCRLSSAIASCEMHVSLPMLTITPHSLLNGSWQVQMNCCIVHRAQC